MAEPDFDTDSLAAYLHLMPRQVERLASRGQLPGRKVAGQWRFSRAEIHHWMEERMGLLDAEQLVQVETTLARRQASISLTAMLRPEAVAVQLQSRSKNAVIKEMVELVAATGLLWDSDAMAKAVAAREDMQTTAMDNGVALLHPRRPQPGILAEPVVAVGLAPQGIPFGGSRGLTNAFFLICSVEDRGHLRTLARLSRLLNNSDFIEQLKMAATPQEVCDVISRSECELPEA